MIGRLRHQAGVVERTKFIEGGIAPLIIDCAALENLTITSHQLLGLHPLVSLITGVGSLTL